MNNKRGDIPLTVLIIGVFAVCTLAIISFIYNSYMINKSLIGIELMEEANAQIEENNLDHIYLYEKVKKLSFRDGFNLFKDKIIFSVEYNP